MLTVDYHLLFMIFSFIVFLVSVFLLFIEPTIEKSIAGMMLTMFNIILCMIIIYSFTVVDNPGFDSTGTVVHNYNVQMADGGFDAVFWAILWVSLMMFIYACYLLIQKPWEAQHQDEEDEEWNLYTSY